MAQELEDTQRQEKEQDRIAEAVAAIEVAILAILAARLGTLDESTTYAKLYAAISNDLAAMFAEVRDGEEETKDRARETLDEMAEENDKWAAAFYIAAGVAQLGIRENKRTGAILETAKKDVGADVSKMVRTSVLRIVAPDGTAKPFREAYMEHCNAALAAIKAGTPPEVATREAVRKLSAYGVRVQYQSGATRELYSAVSMNVMDAYRATLQELRDAQADEFGANGVEVSAHSMCAPDHLPYQGRQFTADEFDAIQNRLGRKIASGKNCRHFVQRVILGVNKKSQKELSRIRRSSTRKVADPSGGTMTAYDFTQWQRNQETRVRKRRMAAQLFEASGDSEAAEAERQKALVIKRNYDQWSKKNGVPTRHERMSIYDWNQRR